MKRGSVCLCFVLFLCWSPCCLFAADALEGASNVLSEVKVDDHVAVPVNPKEAVVRQISAHLERFAKQRDSLTPANAAAGWLDLFDRLWKVNARDLQQMAPEENESSSGPLSFERLFAEIPGPAAWPEIQKLVASRDITKGANGARDYALQLYAAYLNGDEKTFDDLLGKSGELLPGAQHYTSESVVRAVKEIRAASETARSVNSPEDLLKHYRKMLEEFAKDATAPQQGERQIQIPDLVSIAGAAEAEKLLLQTIQLPVMLEVPSGGQTKELLKKLVATNAPQLKQPQWQLVDSPEDVALYEAMLAKFPNVEQKEDKTTASALFTSVRDVGDYENYGSVESKRNAALCYLVGLVASGRSAEALTNAMTMKSGDVGDDFVEVMQKMDKPLVTDALYDFASKMMVKKDAPRVFQSMYCSLALSLGHTNELFSNLQTRMTDPANSDAARRGARWLLIESYLAVDETDKVVAMLRDAVKTTNTNKEESADNQEAPEPVRAATLLVQLGDAIGRPELIDEGVKALLDSAEKSTEERSFDPSMINFGRHYFSESLDDVLIRNGKTAELERMIKASMSAQLRTFEKNKQRGGGSYGMNLDRDLGRLANLYGELGRHKDVLYLVRNAEWWSAGDLAGLMQSYCGGSRTPMAVHIATALAAEGATSNATAILKAYLYEDQGNDKAYSALVGIEGMALIPWLDSLYARDRFEERPLIWKAELLRKAGKLDDAEKFARQAIKVDPTDGEEPPGDRVRAYAVLADVLADEGKKEDAAFFRNVVKSVRTAETGDRLTAVGLVKRSIKVYEEAESAFADAYCVQWRLAERLYSMGKIDEAEKHYKVAFERMPEQFGQVANFCFGCEGVFNKEHSRCVAERVLTNLVKTHPDRPQVHFMMGELREAQGRETEAYESFKKAVEIDPGYLDAWEKMSCLSTLLLLPQSQRDAITLKGLEMDPLGRHFSTGQTEVKDLKALWNILEKNLMYQVDPPKSLFVLEASKKALDEEKKQGRRGYEQRWSRSDRMKPGQVIASQSVASRIVQLLNSTNYARMNMNREEF